MNKHYNSRKNKQQSVLNCASSYVVRLPDGSVLNTGAQSYEDIIRDIVDVVRDLVNDDLAEAIADVFDEILTTLVDDRRIAIENLERRDEAIDDMLDIIETTNPDLYEKVAPTIGKLGLGTTKTKKIREWFDM